MKTAKSNAAVDPGLKRQIRALIQSVGGGHNESEVADIMGNALKLLTDVRVIQTRHPGIALFVPAFCG